MAGKTQSLDYSLYIKQYWVETGTEQLVSVDDVVNKHPGLVWLEPSLLLRLRICR